MGKASLRTWPPRRQADCKQEGEAALREFFNRNAAILPSRALEGMKIGVYQHSTVARDLFVEMLEHYGADVTALGRSEHFIPIDTEAVSEETKAGTERMECRGIL